MRQLCKEQHLSGNYLADFAGLSRGYVSRLLRGQQSPTLDTLEKLAGALGVNVRDLLDEP